MAVIKEIKHGDSLSIGFTLPVDYDVNRIELIEVALGEKVYAHSITGNVISCQISSDETAVLFGINKLTLFIDDSLIGVRKTFCGDIKVNSTNALSHNSSINTGLDINVPIVINESTIEVGDIVYNYVKGDKGDDGNGIESITLLSTVGLVNTYQILYTDATTFDYEVTDGADGLSVSVNNVVPVGGNITLQPSDIGAEPEITKSTGILSWTGSAWAFITTVFQDTANRVTSWTAIPLDTNYPSEKLVKDSLDLKQDDLAFVSETENKFLRDDNTFQTIEQAIGGYANNLYFAETASDVVGYETLTYTPEVAESIESWTVNSSEGEKLLKNYLYGTAVNTTSIPAGLWSINMFGKVSAAAGVTQMGITYFARHSDDSETDLFTVWSNEINNTIDEWIRFQVTNPAFIVVATDRMGARVKIKTTSGTNKTVTYAVGDGYGAFINNPNKIRHTQLRAHDEDIAVQHIDANTEKATIIDADSLVIWDSVAVKAVRSTFAHIKTVLQSTFAMLSGGNTFTGNQSINGNVVIAGAGATPHAVWKLVLGDATTDDTKLYVGMTDIINSATVQQYTQVTRIAPNDDKSGLLISRAGYGAISIGTGVSSSFGIATTDHLGANSFDMIMLSTQDLTAGVAGRWMMLGTGSNRDLYANRMLGSTADTVFQNNALNATRVVARVAGTALQTGDLFDVGILENSTTFNKKFRIDVNGNTVCRTLQSNVASGTPPLIVASTTKVDNLNADKLNGFADTDFVKESGFSPYPQTDLANASGTITLVTNTVTNLTDTSTGAFTIAFAAATANKANDYGFVLRVGGTLRTVNWDAGIVWKDGTAPTLAINKTYYFVSSKLGAQYLTAFNTF
jgi:hypothetical protein